MVVVALTNLSLCFFAADVQCFGRDCYPAVFAINTVLIIAATSKFVIEKYQCYGRERALISTRTTTTTLLTLTLDRN